jgi:hypothetical protein
MTGSDRSKGSGEVKQAHLVRTQGHAGHLRQGSFQTELSRGCHDLVQPNGHAKSDSCGIDRVGKSPRQGHVTILLAPVIFGPPPADLYR